MSERDNFITYDKLMEYKRELQELKTVKRMEILQKLKVARGLGDLSDNPVYDTLKEEQFAVEQRINELTAILKKFQA